MTEPIRVLVVDDEQLVRAGFVLLIDATPDLSAVGEAGDGGEAVRAARRLRPDVVVMDIRMPGIDGLEATRLITADVDAPRILIVTTFDEDDHVFAALRGGASGFLYLSDQAFFDPALGYVVVSARWDAVTGSEDLDALPVSIRPRPDAHELAEALRAVIARQSITH